MCILQHARGLGLINTSQYSLFCFRFRQLLDPGYDTLEGRQMKHFGQLVITMVSDACVNDEWLEGSLS